MALDRRTDNSALMERSDAHQGYRFRTPKGWPRVPAVCFRGALQYRALASAETPPKRPVGSPILSSPETRSDGPRAAVPACCRRTAPGAWPSRRRRPTPGRSRDAAPPYGHGSRQNRRQREVLSRFLRFRFSAWFFARRHYTGDRQNWAQETADPFFMSQGDFGYLEHLDTREGHHEGGHA
jgi:hypothetical protein